MNSTNIKDLSFLENLQKLKSLLIFEVTDENFRSIEKCTHLTSLDIRNYYGNDIKFVQNFNDLEKFKIVAPNATDFDSLKYLNKLKSLTFAGDLPDNFITLQFLKNLITLELREMDDIDNPIQHFFGNKSFVHSLNQLENLQTVKLQGFILDRKE